MAEERHNGYKTTLEGVRAPLGVILYLIRRDNLDIYDIPIARITKEYLEYIDLMEESRIELAGEFFVLAATLLRIKAQMLLRRDDDTEEDPREGLVKSLLEYKKMLEAARTFKELEEERQQIFTRPVPEQEKQFAGDPTIDLSLYQLMKAFREIMYNLDPVEVREIELEEFTIEEKIDAVTRLLQERDQLVFDELFEGTASRMELIVTLMALLELLKHAHVKVNQEAAFGSIWIYRGENFGQPLDETGNWQDEPAAVEPGGGADRYRGAARWADSEPPAGSPPDEFTAPAREPDNEEGTA